jgi:hypothetical protein
METVTVPAGRFDAVKVTRNLHYQDGEWWRSALYQQVTDWFAPSVNRIVRHTERSRYTDYSQGGTDGSVVIVDGDYWVEELLEPARVSR